MGKERVCLVMVGLKRVGQRCCGKQHTEMFNARPMSYLFLHSIFSSCAKEQWTDDVRDWVSIFSVIMIDSLEDGNGD